MSAHAVHLFRIRLLEASRLFKENALVYLLFMPVVFLVAFVLIRRTLEDLSGMTLFFSSEEFIVSWWVLSGVLFPLTSFYFLRWLMVRIFPVQNSDLLFLSLPLSKPLRFYFLVLELFMRNLPLSLVYLLLSTFFLWGEGVAWRVLLCFLPILGLLLSFAQLLLTQALVTFRCLTIPRMGLILISFGCLGWLVGRMTEGQSGFPFFTLYLSLALLGMAWLLSLYLFLWKADVNLQKAEKFLSVERKGFFVILRFILTWVPAGIRPFVIRDVTLTFRRLSSSFLLYPFAVCAVFLGFSFLLMSGWTAPYLPYWVCAVVSYILSSITVPLFRSTFPYLWMDAVNPVRPNDFYFGKIVYAILISLPSSFFVVGIMIVLTPYYSVDAVDPHGLGLGYLLFRLILLSACVSTVVAGFLFEGEQRPILHKVITAMVSVMVSALLAVHWAFVFLMPVVIAYFKDLGLPRLKRIYQEG